MLDPRRIIMMIFGAIIAFIVFMAISFYLYPIINPDAEYESGTIGALGYNPVDFSEFGPQVVAELKNRVSELERQLDESVKKNITYAEQVEELNQKMAETQPVGGVDPLFAGNAGFDENGLPIAAGPGDFNAPTDSVIKKVKALFALEDDEIRPIIATFDVPQLLEIYQQASNRQREQLLRALPPQKATNLLKRVMS